MPSTEVAATAAYLLEHRDRVESSLSTGVTDLFLQQPADPLGFLSNHFAPRVEAPPVQHETHVAARSQDNPQYRGRRQAVPDALVPWGLAFPAYSPETWTHQDVLDNDRELSTGDKWADPPDVSRAGLASRNSFAGNGQPKPLTLDATGMPFNPFGRTGLDGRGMLGKWGPNQAADPIVTRDDPASGKLQVVAIQREDTGTWALPGGMVDNGEEVSVTVRRAFEEVAGKIADLDMRDKFNEQARSPPPHPTSTHCPPSSRICTAMQLVKSARPRPSCPTDT
jgi:ADP-ribose pyrophosphatase